MLQNAYFLAKIGADTAENEQHFAEMLPKTGVGGDQRDQREGGRRDEAGRVQGSIRRALSDPPRSPRRGRLSEPSTLPVRFSRVPGCPARGGHRRPCGKLYRARSRLYRNQILQVKTRWKALAEIYTMHSFAPFSNNNFFNKNC